jgi:hypothetical protein
MEFVGDMQNQELLPCSGGWRGGAARLDAARSAGAGWDC